MTDELEELPPCTDLINAIRAERSPYHSWAGEVIDNSIDFSARNIRLIMDPRRLEITDDGTGMSVAGARSIVQIASHTQGPGTKLGRYGVGLTSKAIQHGNELIVHSVSQDGRLRRSVDWRKIQERRKWLFPPSDWSTAPPETKTGTTVSIRDLIKKPPQPADIEKTYTEIQRRYYPALEDGVQIILNGRIVESLPMPLLKDPVAATLTFPGGRVAHVRGGMLTDQNSKLRQVDLCVAFRVIKPDSIFGTDGYGGIRSMYARVDLIGPWRLTRFKDDIADDPYESELEAAVEDVLRPVLEQCQSQSISARHRELETILNDMLPENKRMVRPEKKNPQNRKGPKDGEKADKSAEGKPTPTGPTKAKKPPRGFQIEFAEHLCEQYGYGRAETTKKVVRIQLAADCPHIAELMKARDQRLIAMALYGMAMLILEGEISDGKLALDETLGLRAWKLGQQQKISDVA